MFCIFLVTDKNQQSQILVNQEKEKEGETRGNRRRRRGKIEEEEEGKRRKRRKTKKYITSINFIKIRTVNMIQRGLVGE